MTQSWTSTHALFHSRLRQNQCLPKRARILIGFSGGQDSLCLLKLLLDLRTKWDWHIATVHCDHRWPSDSGDNATHVAQLSENWNLQHYAFVAPRVLKGEAEGRDWRYEEMANCAQTHRYPYLVTAHTASDRAETLLYHLVRGSGMDGLQALSPTRVLNEWVTLVRPILHMTRQETGDFCQQQGLPIWQDAMNQDLHYRRNRIRLEVLPYLREHFNPNVDRAIAQTAELLESDVAYLESQAQALLAQATPDPSLPQFNREILRAAPLALQRRAIRQFLQHHCPQAPNYSKIEKLVTLTKRNHRDRTDPLFAGVIAEVQHHLIVLRDLRDPRQLIP